MASKEKNSELEAISIVGMKRKVNKRRIMLMMASIAVICGLISSTITPFAFAQMQDKVQSLLSLVDMHS